MTRTPSTLTNTPEKERRAHFRLPLRVRASLRRGGPTFETIAAITQDISSGGCYCISPKILPNGEYIECQVVIAPPGLMKPELRLSLQACVRRVEKLSSEGGEYGIALQIQSYRVVRPQGAEHITCWLGGALPTAIN